MSSQDLTAAELLSFLEDKLSKIEMPEYIEFRDELPKTRQGILKTQIPYASQVELMGLHRSPMVSYAPGSVAGLAYQDLWQEIKAAL